MGTTACWGTNDSFDCEWVSFGYGSRNDTATLWLSLEAYLALSRLDDLPMEDYFSSMSQFNKSLFRSYIFSSDLFLHTDIDKTLIWFEKAIQCRQYYIKNPEKIEEKKKDEEIRKRVYEMYFQSIDNSYTTPRNVDFFDSADYFDETINLSESIINPLILSGYDGKISNYDYIKKLHKSSEYKKRDIYTMGGIYAHKEWLHQCNQTPINWLGGEQIDVPVFADSNPNRNYDLDPEMLSKWDYIIRLRASEWEKMNNWKGQ